MFSRQRIHRAVALVALLAVAAGACGTKNDGQRSAAPGAKGGTPGDNLLLNPQGGDSTASTPAVPDAAPSAPNPGSGPAAGTSSAAPPASGAAPKTAAAPTAKSAAGIPAAPGAAPGSAATPSAPAPAAGGSPAAPAAPGSPANPAKPVVANGQGISDTTIKIGASFPMSGITASFGQEASGAVDAYIKLVNSRGGIAGRKLEYVSYDDGFDPAQTLANVKRLWEKDRVAMVFAFLVDSPNEYVTQNSIPFFTFGGNVRAFSSKYPTVFPAGSAFIGWNAQMAQGLTQAFNRHPKKVAVLTDTETINTHETAKWIQDYWKTAGAEQVFIDPLNLSQGDCSSLVLKYRQAGVEFWDFQSFGFLLCVAAEDRLGWKPPLGQGGPVASMGPISSQAGPSMEGVIAGSPGDLADGRPRFKNPQAAHVEYLDAVRRYQPKLANVDDVNSPGMVAMYMSAVYAMKALQGAADKFGELSQDAVFKWIGQYGSNVDVGIGPPIIGYKPGCKLGNEATWYGTWKWDAQRQKVLNAGPVTAQQIGPKFWTKDPCFLTGIADELVLNKPYTGLHANAASPLRPTGFARRGSAVAAL